MLIHDPSGRVPESTVSQSIFIQLEVANTDDKWLLTASFKIPNERFLIFLKLIAPLDKKKKMYLFLF